MLPTRLARGSPPPSPKYFLSSSDLSSGQNRSDACKAWNVLGPSRTALDDHDLTASTIDDVLARAIGLWRERVRAA